MENFHTFVALNIYKLRTHRTAMIKWLITPTTKAHYVLLIITVTIQQKIGVKQPNGLSIRATRIALPASALSIVVVAVVVVALHPQFF